MAKKKEDVLNELTRVRFVGPALADELYSDHGVRDLPALLKLAREGGLTELNGVGAKKAATILSSVQRLVDREAAPSPSRANAKKTSSPEKAQPKKAEAKKAEAKKAEAKKAEAKKAEAKKAEAKKAEAKKAEAKKAEAKKAPITDVVENITPGKASDESTKASATGGSVDEASAPGKAAASTALPSLRERFISTLRCPACGHDTFEVSLTTITCEACQRQFNLQDDVADLAPPHAPDRSVTQKLMETKFYAQFYEEIMRPRLTGVVSERTMREEYRLAADYLDFGAETRLIDVGCGTGNFTRYFAQRIGLAETRETGGDLPLVVGMDLSWPMLETARRNIRRENLDGRVFLIRGDATRIPVSRASFNRLHCAGTLHLLNDIDEALRNFARILEPGGICVIGTFILGEGMLRRFAKRAAEIPTRFHWFSRDELHKRLERAGFEIVSDDIAGDAITIKARRI
ncbi:methyltransferase domain-containing protein [Lujinxingia sediminis]|uniref:Methyltransferase domain-containing protein n=1 Tax=Lujinxingia sediminis TaxID=2480984 RepID=A0ABY0CRY0_9DELT|nr:class I SAM-dependent methyltransferase [Lujinxingia sediminis]RVU43502.1 methyltransferase domain-containing protein [Lujinxingia sediminis]